MQRKKNSNMRMREMGNTQCPKGCGGDPGSQLSMAGGLQRTFRQSRAAAVAAKQRTPRRKAKIAFLNIYTKYFSSICLGLASAWKCSQGWGGRSRAGNETEDDDLSLKLKPLFISVWRRARLERLFFGRRGACFDCVGEWLHCEKKRVPISPR